MSNRPKLPALEKNTLKYIAFQMVLLLRQVESLKAFVLGSLRASDRIEKMLSDNPPLFPDRTKKIFKKVWAIFVTEGIINEEESVDIQSIIELRNGIGHSIHNLVVDISKPRFQLQNKNIYDYHALERLENYREKYLKPCRLSLY